MKCSVCKKNIETTFLEKPLGTVIYSPGSKKKLFACSNCQKTLRSKEKILESIR